MRCYLSDGLALGRLRGSRGFFQYKDLSKTRAPSIEIPGQPYLWTRKRAEKGSTKLRSIDPLNDKDSRPQLGKLVETLSWEDALALAFSGTKPSEFADLTISDVRKRLSEIQK